MFNKANISGNAKLRTLMVSIVSHSWLTIHVITTTGIDLPSLSLVTDVMDILADSEHFGEVVWQLAQLSYTVLPADVALTIIAAFFVMSAVVSVGIVGDPMAKLYAITRDAVIGGRYIIDDKLSAAWYRHRDTRAETESDRSGTDTDQVVIVEPSTEPTDLEELSSTIRSMVGAAEWVDVFCLPSEIGDEQLGRKESTHVYGVRAADMSTETLKDDLTEVCPDSYLITTTELHRIKPDHGDTASIAAVEYTCRGANWSIDMLTPLAPAYTGEAMQRDTPKPPLKRALTHLEANDCTAVYHVRIRPDDRDTDDMMAIKETYESGPRSAKRKVNDVVSIVTGNSSDAEHDDVNSRGRKYAKDIGSITQAQFVEVDPRIIIVGPGAEQTAREMNTDIFDTLNISASQVEGRSCKGRRARQSYDRAFGPPGGIRAWCRRRLRSPQSRKPVLRGLTRNESTRFLVSEYALPHFLTMDPPGGDTGGERTGRRPPTAPPAPDARRKNTNNDE